MSSEQQRKIYEKNLLRVRGTETMVDSEQREWRDETSSATVSDEQTNNGDWVDSDETTAAIGLQYGDKRGSSRTRLRIRAPQSEWAKKTPGKSA